VFTRQSYGCEVEHLRIGQALSTPVNRSDSPFLFSLVRLPMFTIPIDIGSQEYCRLVSFGSDTSPRALLKPWYWESARHSFRNESAEVLFACAFIEQPVAYERDEVVKFVWREPDWVRPQRIDSE
jgi:hypothetical protein